MGRGAEGGAAQRVRPVNAFRIGFEHPASGEPVEYGAPLMEDMTATLDALRKHRHP